MQICRCARHSTRCTSRVGMGARRVCGQSGRLAVALLVAAAWGSERLSAVCLPAETLPSPAGCRAGIASAPLWDGEQGRVIGMLSASDFIHMLQVCSAGFIPPKPSMPKQLVLVCASPTCLPLLGAAPPAAHAACPCPAAAPACSCRLQRLRSVVSSGVNPMSEQEMDLHTIRCGCWAACRAGMRLCHPRSLPATCSLRGAPCCSAPPPPLPPRTTHTHHPVAAELRGPPKYAPSNM